MIGIGIPSSQSRIGISSPPLVGALGRREDLHCPTVATIERPLGRLDHLFLYRDHTVAIAQRHLR